MASLPNLGVSSMIRSTTGSVAKAFTTTSSALDILSAYVENAKAEQKIDQTIRRETYATKAIEKAGLEEAERILELDEFSSKSDRHHELLTASMKKYHKLIHGKELEIEEPKAKPQEGESE